MWVTWPVKPGHFPDIRAGHIAYVSKVLIYQTYALINPSSMFTLVRDSVVATLGLKREQRHIEFETVEEGDSEEDEKIPAKKVSVSVS